MKITSDLIFHIEKALDFKLFNQTQMFLLTDGSYHIKGGRRAGRTIAYCILLSLSQGEPLDMRKPETFSDYGDGTVRYARNFFRSEFLKIRQKLKDYGFSVREIRF